MAGHSDLWVLLFVVDVMCYGSGSALLCVALSKDRAERELRKAATTDAMTELFNRGAFVSQVEASLRELRRRGAAAAMLLFDLDLFKSINDNHGHLAGDHVLRRFAAILRAELPTDTLAGRLGGEEFAVFLPKFTAAQATALAERIRAALAHADVVFAGASIAATVSCGVCAETAASHQLDSILGCADDALYRAKASGRNRVELNVKAARSGEPDGQIGSRCNSRAHRAPVGCRDLSRRSAAVRRGLPLNSAGPRRFSMRRSSRCYRTSMPILGRGPCGGMSVRPCTTAKPRTRHQLPRLARDHRVAAAGGSRPTAARRSRDRPRCR